MSDVVFKNCDLTGTRFEQASFERVLFDRCRLMGGLSESQLGDVVFEGTDLRYTHFLDAWFGPAKFVACKLQEASFQDAHMAGVVFEGCDLTTANFRKANLLGGDWRGSRLAGVFIHPKDLNGLVISADQAVDLIHLLGVEVR